MGIYKIWSETDNKYYTGKKNTPFSNEGKIYQTFRGVNSALTSLRRSKINFIRTAQYQIHEFTLSEPTVIS